MENLSNLPEDPDKLRIIYDLREYFLNACSDDRLANIIDSYPKRVGLRLDVGSTVESQILPEMILLPATRTDEQGNPLFDLKITGTLDGDRTNLQIKPDNGSGDGLCVTSIDGNFIIERPASEASFPIIMDPQEFLNFSLATIGMPQLNKPLLSRLGDGEEIQSFIKKVWYEHGIMAGEVSEVFWGEFKLDDEPDIVHRIKHSENNRRMDTDTIELVYEKIKRDSDLGAEWGVTVKAIVESDGREMSQSIARIARSETYTVRELFATVKLADGTSRDLRFDDENDLNIIKEHIDSFDKILETYYRSK